MFTNLGPGASGQFSAIFFNDGTTTWAPGVVGLLVCAADKVTCNVASPNAAYASGWFSSTVYASVSAAVAPGQNGFFIYNFVVPAGTPAGTAATFNGDVGLIASGLEFRPQGYFQINTTPSAAGGLTLAPSSASLAVGATQQFTASGASAGATITWSVTGGCGAVTNAGLFAATATNSATQPCSVNAASSDGLSASAPITVFGPASQIGCSANPSSVVANGSNTVTFSFTLKDANGNTVSNSSAAITVNNVTPSLITLTGGNTQTVPASNGVVTITGTVSTSTGNIQVSASGTGLTGCNVIVASSAPGTAVKTATSLSRNPIAADNISTSTLTVKIQDANGNTVIGDSTDVISATRDASSANICSITAVTTGTGSSFSAGSGSATAAAGTVAFTLTASSTPGSCLIAITTNNTSVAGTSTTLTTQIVGAPNKLSVSSTSPSPATAPAAGTGTCNTAGTGTNASCIIVTILVNDVNGNRVTGDSASVITAALATDGSCTAAGGGAAVIASTNPATASAGRAQFAFNSPGAYSGCTVTFTGTNGTATLASTTSTLTWTPGGADHLTCSFSPQAIVADGSSTSNATVRVRDALGNTVSSGSYSVTFSRTAGTSTTLLTANPQSTSGGSTSFTVRSTTTTGTDSYQGNVTSGSTPTLPLTAGGSNSPSGNGTFAIGSNGLCLVSNQTTVP